MTGSQAGTPEAAPLPTLQFDTSSLPEAEQFTVWASHVANSKVTRLAPPGPFHARSNFWRLEPLLLSEQWVDAFAFDRDEEMVRSTSADHYSLAVVLEGELRLRRPGGDDICGPGDAIFTDLRRTESTYSPARHHSVTVHFARWFLDEALDPVDQHGRMPRTPATRVLVDFITTLTPQLPGLPAASALPIARVLRDLMVAALVGLPLRRQVPAGRQPLRQRVRAYIEGQAPGTLDVGRLCRELGVTRSSVNRAFKADGGVLAFDRRRRLLALHARLSDATEPRSISELGFDYGFQDKSHFSRVFRETFGYPPSEVRRLTGGNLAGPPVPGTPAEAYRAALLDLS